METAFKSIKQFIEDEPSLKEPLPVDKDGNTKLPPDEETPIEEVFKTMDDFIERRREEMEKRFIEVKKECTEWTIFGACFDKNRLRDKTWCCPTDCPKLIRKEQGE